MATTKPRPLAIVTGASRGIGYELAWQFAEHGYDLIIAAEDAAINDAASHRRRQQVEAMQVDLAAEDGVERLYQQIHRHGLKRTVGRLWSSPLGECRGEQCECHVDIPICGLPPLARG